MQSINIVVITDSSGKVRLDLEVSRSTLDTLRALRSNDEQSLGDIVDDLVDKAKILVPKSRKEGLRVRMGSVDDK